MKVYTVFSGSYSDRGMVGVFSTREKAQAFIDRERIADGDIDNSPNEVELDVCLPREFVEVIVDGETGSYQVSSNTDDLVGSDGVLAQYDRFTKKYRVRVAICSDLDTTIKAARDKLAMWKAREAGI